MTRIKLCGLSRECDIQAANELRPEYIGFVFFRRSIRNISFEKAAELKRLLSPSISAVGVFVNESVQTVANLLNTGTIDMAQLHGSEDADYLKRLRDMTDRPVIRAFCLKTPEDARAVQEYPSDYVLLDSGTGSGVSFDWQLAGTIHRPCFLAGGLDPDNVQEAIRFLHPYAVDVSSGIETDGKKDLKKMAAFVSAVRRST